VERAVTRRFKSRGREFYEAGIIDNTYYLFCSNWQYIAYIQGVLEK
jgi:hypothetical protein